MKFTHEISYIVPKWFLVNLLFSALVWVGFQQGVLQEYLIDDTNFTLGIILVGVIALLYSLWASIRINSDWKKLDYFQYQFDSAVHNNHRSEYKDGITEQFSRRISWTGVFFGATLVSMGLLGTILGIRIALIDIGADVVSNPAVAEAFIVSVGHGMATAFHTTLVGIVLMMWNHVNFMMLKNETSRLYQAIIS